MPPTQEIETTVVCRPSGEMQAAAWLGIALGAGTIVGSTSLPFLPPGSIWLGIAAGCFACSFFTLPFGIWMAAYVFRASIIADTRGLRWREVGRWRIAAWSDVTAYYDTWEHKSKSSTLVKLSKVETRRGTLVLSSGKWTNVEQLRDCIGQYAAKTAGSETAQNVPQSVAPFWNVQGGLLKCLPLRCHYATTVNRNLLG
ncbi:MAG: hypothetical protein ACRYFS_10645 [Janthinobacterium lividum]